MLKNYQIALMKSYYDAGLKSIAQATGYPVKQLKNCRQFKRAHHFILEAIYRSMIDESFLESGFSTTGTRLKIAMNQSVVQVEKGTKQTFVKHSIKRLLN